MQYSLKPELIKLHANSRLHNCQIPIIGLTGGIASGKTTVAKLLADKKFKIINADKLIKTIYAEAPTIAYVRKNWPSSISNEQIDFKILRKLFFNDSTIQKSLEDFLYKKMPEKFLAQIAPTDPFVFYDVPLLFEKQLNQSVDFSVCVYCSKENQITRLIERDQIGTELAKSIIDKQLDLSEKALKSDFVIDNNSDRDALTKNLESFIKNIFMKTTTKLSI